LTRIIAVIPARMGSSRFPGKPLAPLCGRPMIQHVYERTAACARLDDVFIATCDAEIAQAAQSFGAKSIMTSPLHERATDRVAEAVAHDSAQIVVMVQGDEPMILPSMIDEAIAPLLADARVGCVNLAAVIRTEEELRSPNTIKTAASRSGRALFFSRAAIPTLHARRFVVGEWWKQVCIIAFRAAALQEFTKLPKGPLEQAESIDMLRILENDGPIQLAITRAETHAVDTPEDLRLVASLLQQQGGFEPTLRGPR
jgi:3-deoxy-manno-octulosonate cytidylyltransferase (CMP-KDO synthetase)